MTSLSANFKARLGDGLTQTCLCWRLTRRDGTVLGLTEHDRGLTVAGIDYEPGAALEAGTFTGKASLAPGQAAARGAFFNAAIMPEEIYAGLWDGARIDVFRVDWGQPSDYVHVWSGYFSEIRHGENGFEAELVSLKADLERPIGRVYTRGCTAELGDTACGIDLSAPDYAGAVCDQRLETCITRFDNAENYRGFAHMPGPDFILAGPAASGNSGGKR